MKELNDLILMIAEFKENLYEFASFSKKILIYNKSLCKRLNQNAFEIGVVNDLSESIINFMKNFKEAYLEVLSGFCLFEKVKFFNNSHMQRYQIVFKEYNRAIKNCYLIYENTLQNIELNQLNDFKKLDDYYFNLNCIVDNNFSQSSNIIVHKDKLTLITDFLMNGIKQCYIIDYFDKSNEKKRNFELIFDTKNKELKIIPQSLGLMNFSNVLENSNVTKLISKVPIYKLNNDDDNKLLLKHYVDLINELIYLEQRKHTNYNDKKIQNKNDYFLKYLFMPKSIKLNRYFSKNSEKDLKDFKNIFKFIDFENNLNGLQIDSNDVDDDDDDDDDGEDDDDDDDIVQDSLKNDEIDRTLENASRRHSKIIIKLPFDAKNSKKYNKKKTLIRNILIHVVLLLIFIIAVIFYMANKLNYR
jgi:hypothetical protein